MHGGSTRRWGVGHGAALASGKRGQRSDLHATCAGGGDVFGGDDSFAAAKARCVVMLKQCTRISQCLGRWFLPHNVSDLRCCVRVHLLCMLLVICCHHCFPSSLLYGCCAGRRGGRKASECVPWQSRKMWPSVQRPHRLRRMIAWQRSGPWFHRGPSPSQRGSEAQLPPQICH